MPIHSNANNSEDKVSNGDPILTFDEWMLSNSETDLTNTKFNTQDINNNGTIDENRIRKTQSSNNVPSGNLKSVNVVDSSSFNSSSGSWFEPLENILSPDVSSNSSKNSTPKGVKNGESNSNNNNSNRMFNRMNANSFYQNSNNYNNIEEFASSLNNDLNPRIKRENEPQPFSPGLPAFPLVNYEISQKYLENMNNHNDSNNNNNNNDNNNIQQISAIRENTEKRKYARKKLTDHQKEAHNKIEKRYRNNINTKITQLQQIIPWVASEQTSFVADEYNEDNVSQDNLNNIQFAQMNDITGGETPRLNKSMILEKAVDYILYLQNNERLYELEVQRLKMEVDSLKRRLNNNAQ
ncbi:hypothetical protein TPHA_0H02820 [Tetrapisispora phaffii CBS 4417]|uniref:BHLH domain-containing protein n=1 Tax=Tetrapisispora phaffii (strain ATCC 24235 / CBS 4417 / NBRC 1672 / NRRL Y-8282 / UCD 70-5) TaxID=1071381 RepID=G8BWN4_TETPH|nr:hypothetical protein TPHA_0H02820 [Tetrapisispora phaffii CBS 4417]CCE64485.1 hypothetical protein TPHA_0H02820 [Tetrapisispora phaffii CBS 4417]